LLHGLVCGDDAVMSLASVESPPFVKELLILDPVSMAVAVVKLDVLHQQLVLIENEVTNKWNVTG